MELRDLRAFVAAAHELHFARAATALYIGPSTMSELIRRLEIELGTPLFTRTTRRITLTDAGTEFLGRAETILDLATGRSRRCVPSPEEMREWSASASRHRPRPYLAARFTASLPNLSVDIQQMWLPSLGTALHARAIDAALTCGELGITDPDIATAEIGSEPLLIGVRSDHPLSTEASIDLRQLADHTLGIHPAHLFPAWHAPNGKSSPTQT